ncbi:MAG: hypothetical protein EZS28_007720 [Streblomastix strix]|uniref:Uncharacterized protein n=1 Tax=Streblomastix strix TaxID=222440 RepID=A0A5J4WQC3_9EUKA|nr:MAG: hypothetical protein EZS28_007720 [Streblomastix strix]
MMTINLNGPWKSIQKGDKIHQLGQDARNYIEIIHTSLVKLQNIFDVLIEKLEQTEIKIEEDRKSQTQKIEMVKLMLDAKNAQIMELKEETANLRKQQEDVEKQIVEGTIYRETEQKQKIDQLEIKQKENEEIKQEKEKEKEVILDDSKEKQQLQDLKDGTPKIEERRYTQIKVLNNPQIMRRTGNTDDSKMGNAIHGYRINEPRNFVMQHLSAVRDIALHPQLMLLASASDDGTVSLLDVSHSIKSTPLPPVEPPSSSNQIFAPVALQSKLTPHSQSYFQHNLEPKWNFKQSRQLTIFNRKKFMEQQGLQSQQIVLRKTRSYCVKFLPYLESSNDKSRKQSEIQSASKSGSQKSNVPQTKKMSYDLGCILQGDSQGKVTVYALPDPKMMMFDQLKKLEKNKMFEFDAHSDSIWSVDESAQRTNKFIGAQLPKSGDKLVETRIATASADGTVKLWNINTDGQPDQSNADRGQIVYHKMLNEFRHTPSNIPAIVDSWWNCRKQQISIDEIRQLKPIDKINDKWEDSDIPTSVIFDPVNVANLIVGYVSGDIVRYDIDNGVYNFMQVGQRTESERILSISKSMTATHYQTQDTIPLLVATNSGYLHVVDTNNLQTIFSYKAYNSQNTNLITATPQIPNKVSDQTDYIQQQLAAKWIFTSSTYLQYDSLIAASTNFGRVFMYDLRMADKGQVGIIGEQSMFSQHDQTFSEGITKITAHPIHPVLITAGSDGIIKVFSSNPP